MEAFLQQLGIAAIPAIITGFTSWLLCKARIKAEIEQNNKKNKHEIEKLMKQHSVDIDSLEKEHSMKMKELEKQHTQEIEIMRLKHEQNLKTKSDEAMNSVMTNLLNTILTSPEAKELLFKDIKSKTKTNNP